MYTISVNAHGLCPTFYFLYCTTVTVNRFGGWSVLFGGLFTFVYI